MFNWRFSLTNWTFGAWYESYDKERRFGIDLGPLELWWVW